MSIHKGKYDERSRFWTEQALNQFGNTSNFFFVISLGLFGYLLEKFNIKSLFNINLDAEFKVWILFLAISVTSVTISLLASGLTILSRLHDLRTTRHILHVRKKSLETYKKEYKDVDIDIDKYNFLNQLKNLVSTAWSRNYFIKDIDIQNKKTIKEKFHKLRVRNLLLARFSWKMMNFQIICLMIAIVSYCLYALFRT